MSSVSVLIANGTTRRTTVSNEAATLLIWRVTLLYNTTVDCIGHNRATPVRQKCKPASFIKLDAALHPLLLSSRSSRARCNLRCAAPLVSISSADRKQETGDESCWQTLRSSNLSRSSSFHFRHAVVSVSLVSVRILSLARYADLSRRERMEITCVVSHSFLRLSL